MAQFLDHALSGNVVGQAGKGLNTGNAGYARVNQLHHLCGKEPPFSRDISQLYDIVHALHQVVDGGWWVEPLALAQHLLDAAAIQLQEPNQAAGISLRLLGEGQFLVTEDAGGEGVEQKVCQVRHNALSPFSLDNTANVVVGGGMELYQNLTNYTNTRLLNIQQGQLIKFLHNALNQLVIFYYRQRL